MRQEYLWDFTYTCRIPPPQVDALCYWDFIQLIVHIKHFNEQQEKIQREMQQHANP